ncbi:hypothetical protein PoHVEF18_010216 [Penicillium ochrochloron]|uniref:O-methyltransferase okaF n=1 Tax=Penicillium ochrochloron TaxID=69780 RepID=OKAF_PENOH|nr:methyltransferase [Penicillium simplicissimum]
MEAIAQEIQKLHANTDEAGRGKINHDLSVLLASFDTDWEKILKLAAGPLRLALVKVGVDQGIFHALNERSHTLPELIEKTGVAPYLLERILRGQASFGMIKEEGAKGFAANRFTTLLAGPNTSGAVTYIFDILRPIASAIPGFLSERNNPAITSTHDTVFQRAFNTELGGFEWMTGHPEHYGNLFQFLALRPNCEWVDAFPIEAEIGSFTNDPHVEKVLLVDVGGGTGAQSVAFRKKLPHVKGRVIVQEIAETLIHVGAKAPAGIEFMEYDCFTPQPIRGAKFYYLRYVMHLWQDERCVEALKVIITAMGPESRLIIDEAVIPDRDVPWQAACQSILMTAALAGAERTLTEWHNLLDAAGLKILNIFPYDLNMQSVIIAVPK